MGARRAKINHRKARALIIDTGVWYAMPLPGRFRY
jgi:hypothetical protein